MLGMLPVVGPPELHNGDRMSTDEFLQRWEQIPELKHAELIDGVVYMASPVSLAHGSYERILAGWLNHYAFVTGQDLLIACNTTLLDPNKFSIRESEGE